MCKINQGKMPLPLQYHAYPGIRNRYPQQQYSKYLKSVIHSLELSAEGADLMPELSPNLGHAASNSI